jgi:hypothetical protein
LAARSQRTALDVAIHFLNHLADATACYPDAPAENQRRMPLAAVDAAIQMPIVSVEASAPLDQAAGLVRVRVRCGSWGAGTRIAEQAGNVCLE